MKRIDVIKELYTHLGNVLEKNKASLTIFLTNTGQETRIKTLQSILPFNIKVVVDDTIVSRSGHTWWNYQITFLETQTTFSMDELDDRDDIMNNIISALSQVKNNFISKFAPNIKVGVYQSLKTKNYYLYNGNQITRINSIDQQSHTLIDDKNVFSNNEINFIHEFFDKVRDRGSFFAHEFTKYTLDFYEKDILVKNDSIDKNYAYVETTPIEISKINFSTIVNPNTTRVYVIKNDISYGYFNVKDNEKSMFNTCERTNFILTNLGGAPNERMWNNGQHISATTYNASRRNCTSCGHTFVFENNQTTCNVCLEMKQRLSGVFGNDVDMDAHEFIQQPHTTSIPLTFTNVANETNPLFMGVELEVDSGYIDYDSIDEDTDEPNQSDGEGYSSANLNVIAKNILGVLAPKGNAYAMWDGSLINGFEIATHPATLKSHMDNSVFNYKDAFKKLGDLSIQSHEPGTCGLHVHISRSFFGSDQKVQDLNATKLAILLETNWTKFVKFTRRNGDQLDRWAQRGKVAGFLGVDTTQELVERFKRNYSDKYVALNTQHRNTYEFRIFRGTTNYETFIATLMLVDNLARIVKDIDIKDLTNVKFSDIINYGDHETLKNYWGRRE